MKIEQTARDENVAEYLKLVDSADKQQVARIKQVFEKKNQKSAHTISQLQKKLEQYHKKLKETEQNVPSKNSKDASKDNLKEIQQTPKDAGSTQRTGNSGQESKEKSKTIGPGVRLRVAGRYERLEDQFNDLTELHQHETTNLKQELSSIEEKVAYQAYERSRDIEEVLESCQTKISKLELQQQQQQVVQFENTNAKVLLGKSINIMLAIVTVILVCVSTIAKFTAPLMKSRLHVICTFFAVALLAIFWKNWEHFQIAIERLLLPN
ncbi:UNVERIFIED_CONTAM: hypothetical protein FKN15_052771 [Acipenser sinensis]